MQIAAENWRGKESDPIVHGNQVRMTFGGDLSESLPSSLFTALVRENLTFDSLQQYILSVSP